MDNKLNIKHFRNRYAAKKFADSVGEDTIYHYSNNSPTRDDYITLMEIKEGYFDEDFAMLYPYLVEYDINS